MRSAQLERRARYGTRRALRNDVTEKYTINIAYASGRAAIHLAVPFSQARTAELTAATASTAKIAPVVSWNS
jgi:hypothetical protein